MSSAGCGTTHRGRSSLSLSHLAKAPPLCGSGRLAVMSPEDFAIAVRRARAAVSASPLRDRFEIDRPTVRLRLPNRSAPPFSCTRARARRCIDAARAERHRSGQLAAAADQPGLLPQVLRGLEGAIAPALHDFRSRSRQRRLATARARRCGRRRGARPGARRAARSNGRQCSATRASRPRTTVAADDLRLVARRGSRGPSTRRWLAWVLVACPVCVWTRMISLV